jgi:hypothetical protein
MLLKQHIHRNAAFITKLIQIQSLGYETADDLAQGTGIQQIITKLGSDAMTKIMVSGFITLFNPSSTTYVKHFII